jgi:hypothetical protein
MDLNDEKEKAKFIYGLELRKLVLDKCLFGLIIVLLGVLANVAFERYRSSLNEQRFLLEKRLEAIANIKAAFEEVIDLWDEYTLGEAELPSDYKIRYKKSVDAFSAQSNKWNVLLKCFPKILTDY